MASQLSLEEVMKTALTREELDEARKAAEQGFEEHGDRVGGVTGNGDGDESGDDDDLDDNTTVVPGVGLAAVDWEAEQRSSNFPDFDYTPVDVAEAAVIIHALLGNLAVAQQGDPSALMGVVASTFGRSGDDPSLPLSVPSNNSWNAYQKIASRDPKYNGLSKTDKAKAVKKSYEKERKGDRGWANELQYIHDAQVLQAADEAGKAPSLSSARNWMNKAGTAITKILQRTPAHTAVHSFFVQYCALPKATPSPLDVRLIVSSSTVSESLLRHPSLSPLMSMITLMMREAQAEYMRRVDLSVMPEIARIVTAALKDCGYLSLEPVIRMMRRVTGQDDKKLVTSLLALQNKGNKLLNSSAPSPVKQVDTSPKKTKSKSKAAQNDSDDESSTSERPPPARFVAAPPRTPAPGPSTTNSKGKQRATAVRIPITVTKLSNPSQRGNAPHQQAAGSGKPKRNVRMATEDVVSSDEEEHDTPTPTSRSATTKKSAPTKPATKGNPARNKASGKGETPIEVSSADEMDVDNAVTAAHSTRSTRSSDKKRKATEVGDSDGDGDQTGDQKNKAESAKFSRTRTQSKASTPRNPPPILKPNTSGINARLPPLPFTTSKNGVLKSPDTTPFAEMRTWNATDRFNYISQNSKENYKLVKEWEYKKYQTLLEWMASQPESLLLARFKKSGAPSPSPATIHNIPHVTVAIPAGQSNSPALLEGRSGTGKLVTIPSTLHAVGWTHLPTGPGDSKAETRESLTKSLCVLYPYDKDEKNLYLWGSIPAYAERMGFSMLNLPGHVFPFKVWMSLAKLDAQTQVIIRDGILCYEEAYAFMLVSRHHFVTAGKPLPGFANYLPEGKVITHYDGYCGTTEGSVTVTDHGAACACFFCNKDRAIKRANCVKQMCDDKLIVIIAHEVALEALKNFKTLKLTHGDPREEPYCVQVKHVNDELKKDPVRLAKCPAYLSAWLVAYPEGIDEVERKYLGVGADKPGDAGAGGGTSQNGADKGENGGTGASDDEQTGGSGGDVDEETGGGGDENVENGGGGVTGHDEDEEQAYLKAKYQNRESRNLTIAWSSEEDEYDADSDSCYDIEMGDKVAGVEEGDDAAAMRDGAASEDTAQSENDSALSDDRSDDDSEGLESFSQEDLITEEQDDSERNYLAFKAGQVAGMMMARSHPFVPPAFGTPIPDSLANPSVPQLRITVPTPHSSPTKVPVTDPAPQLLSDDELPDTNTLLHVPLSTTTAAAAAAAAAAGGGGSSSPTTTISPERQRSITPFSPVESSEWEAMFVEATTKLSANRRKKLSTTLESYAGTLAYRLLGPRVDVNHYMETGSDLFKTLEEHESFKQLNSEERLILAPALLHCALRRYLSSGDHLAKSGFLSIQAIQMLVNTFFHIPPSERAREEKLFGMNEDAAGDDGPGDGDGKNEKKKRGDNKQKKRSDDKKKYGSDDESSDDPGGVMWTLNGGVSRTHFDDVYHATVCWGTGTLQVLQLNILEHLLYCVPDWPSTPSLSKNLEGATDVSALLPYISRFRDVNKIHHAQGSEEDRAEWLSMQVTMQRECGDRLFDIQCALSSAGNALRMEVIGWALAHLFALDLNNLSKTLKNNTLYGVIDEDILPLFELSPKWKTGDGEDETYIEVDGLDLQKYFARCLAYYLDCLALDNKTVPHKDWLLDFEIDTYPSLLAYFECLKAFRTFRVVDDLRAKPKKKKEIDHRKIIHSKLSPLLRHLTKARRAQIPVEKVFYQIKDWYFDWIRARLWLSSYDVLQTRSGSSERADADNNQTFWETNYILISDALSTWNWKDSRFVLA